MAGEKVLKCTSCQAEIIGKVPLADIINKETYSMMVMVHEPVTCSNCGATYTFILKKVEQITYNWTQIAAQKKDDRVIAIPSPQQVAALDQIKGR